MHTDLLWNRLINTREGGGAEREGGEGTERERDRQFISP